VVRRFLLTGAVLVAALLVAQTAVASDLVTRLSSDPRGTNAVRLKIDRSGKAVIYYGSKHPLFWGAINARRPSPTRAQVTFRRDYSGGFKSFRKPIWKTIKNACQPYDGPALAWLVRACKAPDGSYWALQAWQRMLPNLGFDPWRSAQSQWELHLSHWRGPLPQLEVYLDWAYSGRYHHLFGRFTYQGAPVFGFKATGAGVPLDSYGRNVYADTLDSEYGPGWKRENSFLAHNPKGNFCYGFYPHKPYAGYPGTGTRPEGNGARYRLTALGPGVTPVVMWEGQGLPDFDRSNQTLVAHESAMNALAAQIHAGDASRTPCTDR
jgi:hypothetical protein